MDLFPSRTITLYLARLFVTRILGILVMLTLILQMLDLLSESGYILAAGNDESQLWYYVSLRAPQIMARFLPYSVLLATLFTFWPLNQNSEVIAMRAAGLSAHQVLAPMLLTAAFVSLISFAFNEFVVAPGTGTLKQWSALKYQPVPKDTGVRYNVYLPDGPNILTAGTVTGTGPATVLDNVTWYPRNAAGMVTEQVRSPRAVYANPGWRMDNPARFDVASTVLTRLPGPLVVASGVTPAQLAITTVDPDGQNIFALGRTIAALKASGRRTTELEAKWWHKLSGPLSALLMPLLGSVAAFGLARSGTLLIRAISGMALGFTYFVVDNAALAMGNFGGYPPLIAAWAPVLLFTLVGETVLVRTEE